jgi:cell division transport system ATP-binding protein
MVEFENVTKIYERDIYAVNDVSFEVRRGEFVFLSGASGAGKSTLLRLLSRQELADQGRVMVDGVELASLSSRQIPLHRRKIGIIYQDFKLLYDRNVYENVAFALRVLGLSKSEIRRETELVLEKVGLSHRAFHNPHKLSGGEQQCVAVARALVHDPFLVLADEPTGNLDEDTSWRIFELLLDAQARGATVMVASHNQNIIRKLKKRTLVLQEGSLVRQIKSKEYADLEEVSANINAVEIKSEVVNISSSEVQTSPVEFEIFKNKIEPEFPESLDQEIMPEFKKEQE